MTSLSNLKKVWSHEEVATPEDIEAKRKTAPLLWGRHLSASPLKPLALPFRPLGLLFATRPGFWLGFGSGILAYLWFGHQIRMGAESLLPVGPRTFWGKLLAIWFFSNLSVLVRAAAIEKKVGIDRLILSWRIFVFLPFLTTGGTSLKEFSMKEALRTRLSGTAFLWTLGFTMVVAMGFTETPRMDEPLILVAVASFLVGFLQFSPWWSSPVKDTVLEAHPESDFPWNAWHYLWGPLWRHLFVKKGLTEQEIYLNKVTIFLLFWTVFALRLGTFILRNLANQLYLDSTQVSSVPHDWFLKAAAAGVALLGVFTVLSVLLFFLIRGVRFVSELFK